MVVNFVCTNYNHLGNLKIYVQAPSQTIQLKSLNQILYITHTHTHTHTEGFPGGSDGKESACNVGDPGLIPGLG